MVREVREVREETGLEAQVTGFEAQVTGLEVQVTGLVGIYADPRHVISYADGEVRQ
ncbi:MAG TPA: hypothetical protein VGL36_30240 [Kribbella sp.]